MLMLFGVQSEWEEPVDLPESGCGVHGVRVMPGEGWESGGGEVEGQPCSCDSSVHKSSSFQHPSNWTALSLSAGAPFTLSILAGRGTGLWC